MLSKFVITFLARHKRPFRGHSGKSNITGTEKRSEAAWAPGVKERVEWSERVTLFYIVILVEII